MTPTIGTVAVPEPTYRLKLTKHRHGIPRNTFFPTRQYRAERLIHVVGAYDLVPQTFIVEAVSSVEAAALVREMVCDCWVKWQVWVNRGRNGERMAA